MRRGLIIGLAMLLFAVVSQIEAIDGDENETQQTNRQLVDTDEQGHENTSGRKVRQFGFGYPPPPPPFGFGGAAGFGGPGFGGGYGGGYGGGVRVRERFRVRERVVTRTRNGGFYG